MQAERLGKVV